MAYSEEFADRVRAVIFERPVGPMDFTGRPMRGFVIVEAEGTAGDSELYDWIETGASFAESLSSRPRPSTSADYGKMQGPQEGGLF